MLADVVTLVAGPLEARWVPDVGMVGASLRHRGRELLGQRGGLDGYRARGSTFGIPLLHPWANRLGGFAYRVGASAVALDSATPGLRTEEHGLPIHGLLAASPDWRVVAQDACGLSAELDFDDPVRLEAFPFAHRMRLDIDLAPRRLAVTATLTPAPGVAVPVAFGFHPYFTLPGVAREDLVLGHAAMTRLALDDRGLPTGERVPIDARDAPLGGATYDDLYTDLGPEPAVTLAGGGRRLTVRLLEGFTHLQLFAPPASATVAVEPMTAPTDALRTGDGLRVVDAPFTAAFAVEVDA
jgi:aldose 1-epimerase